MSFRESAPAWMIWFGNRLAAAIAGAALLGIVISIGANVSVDLTSQPGLGANLLGGYVYWAIYFAIAAIILGTVPGTLVLCLSRARFHPWRSLPRLLLGMVIGFVVVALPFWLQPGTNMTTIVTFIGPTVGGTIAALTIRAE